MSERDLAIRQALGVERLGEIMWKSGYWQDTRSQAQAIVKILRGAELEIGPIASMDGVYIIEGKTSLNATLMGSLIQRSGRYRYRVVEHDETHCVIDFFEIVGGKREKLGTSKFDDGDAKAAGLLDRKGGMWGKYPRNMYFSRALSNGAKWYTPDIFNGPVYTPDELGAEVDEGGNVVQLPAEVQVQVEEVQVPRTRTITSADDPLWKRWEVVRAAALKVGVVPPNLTLPVGYEQLVSNATMVKAQTEAKQATLQREEDARAAAAAERGAAPVTDVRESVAAGAEARPQAPWQRNRELQAQVYARGFRGRDLPSDATEEQVEAQNAALEAWLNRQTDDEQVAAG